MKIAFLGAGNMGLAMGKRLAAKGHQLMFSFSRDHDRLRQQAKEASADAAVGLPEDAVAWADLIVLAVPYQAAPAALAKAGQLRGKLVWSIVNPLKTDFSGLEVGTTTSGAEELAKLAPGSRFVAALPPFAEVLHSGEPLPLNASVFVCGDDEPARKIVMELLRDMGADPVDAGALFAARFFEPALMGLVYLAHVRGLGGKIGLHFIRT